MKQLFIAILAIIATVQTVSAASISTYPMRVELEEESNIGNITVFNSGDKPANIQVRAMDWKQDSKTGEEQLSETSELVFFPKIFSIPAKGQQMVRVGYQGKVGDREKSFRLFVRELPVDEPGVTGARFALQISSPAFIYPKGAQQPTKPEIKGIELADGKLMARIENHGVRYYSMNKLEISGSKANQSSYSSEVAGWYVLAGSSKLFPLNISRADCLKMDSIALTAHTQKDKSQGSFPVNAKVCDGIKDQAATAAR